MVAPKTRRRPQINSEHGHLKAVYMQLVVPPRVFGGDFLNPDGPERRSGHRTARTFPEAVDGRYYRTSARRD